MWTCQSSGCRDHVELTLPCCGQQVQLCPEGLFADYGVDMPGETQEVPCPGAKKCDAPLVVAVREDGLEGKYTISYLHAAE
jgi:hypothetical protein